MYVIGVFPLLLVQNVSWPKEAVAIGSALQVRNPRFNCRGASVQDRLLITTQVIATMVECPIRVLAFVGAASCFLVLRAPVFAFFATSCVYGCFYASFLNKVRRRSA